MARNVLLLISTAAILVVLYFGYAWLIQDPPADDYYGPAAQSPPRHSADPNAAIEVSDGVQTLTLPAGEATEFTLYDPRTGRARQRVRFADWTKAPGRENEIIVSAPEMTLLLPRGQIVTISADKGQIAVEEIRRTDMQPQSGRLEGHARIMFDRATTIDRAPIAERPEDLITIDLETLEFDIADGLLRSEGAVQVSGSDINLRGAGLELVWNQADNRIERLVLAGGGEITLRRQIGLLGGLTERGAAPASDSQSEAAAPSTAAKLAYWCQLAGDVTAEQWVGDQRVAGLTARDVELLFDITREGWPASAPASDVAPTTQLATSAPSSAPTSRPADPNDAPKQRFVVRWTGPLSIQPRHLAAGDRGARRLVAHGPEVELYRGDRRVLCGKLEFHDDTQQVWLHPRGDGRVRFAVGDAARGVEAAANSAYVDLANDIVKLVGDVRLSDRRGDAATAMHSTLWAELHLSQRDDESAVPTDAAKALVDITGLRAATFVGDVLIASGDQRLRSERIELRFREGVAGETIEALLDHAIATGSVRLIVRYPNTAAALGRVLLNGVRTASGLGGTAYADAEQALTCDWLTADFAPDAAGRARPRHVDASGQVELFDRVARVAARGRRLIAGFDADGALRDATVSGASSRLAWVYADPFAVRGETIEIDPRSQSLRVPGRSRLSFSSDVTLQGRARPG